jgi:hypothetical protein
MRAFGFYPDAVLGRMSASGHTATPPPTLVFSVVYGAVSLAAVSVLAFSPWAFRLIRGEQALYAVIALIYIALAGVTFSRLIIGPGAATRFAALFGCGFVIYAVVWCACWFGLGRKAPADLWGNIAGAALLGVFIARAFGTSRLLIPVIVLLALYLAGYYAGGWIYSLGRRPYGALGWGAAYGCGFGAGLGFLLYAVQQPLKNQLAAATSPAPARLPGTPA